MNFFVDQFLELALNLMTLVSLALLFPFYQTDALQFAEQLCRLVLAAVQHGHSFLLGEIEEHAPVIVQPAIAGGQPHAVKQQAVQHLCFQRYALVAAVGQ